MTALDLINLVLGLWVVAQIAAVALVGIAIFYIVDFIRHKKERKK